MVSRFDQDRVMYLVLDTYISFLKMQVIWSLDTKDYQEESRVNFYVGTVEPRFSGALKIIILQKISANCKKKMCPNF